MKVPVLMCSRHVDAGAHAHPCEQVFDTVFEKRLPVMSPLGAGGSRMLEPPWAEGWMCRKKAFCRRMIVLANCKTLSGWGC